MIDGSALQSERVVFMGLAPAADSQARAVGNAETLTPLSPVAMRKEMQPVHVHKVN